MAAEVQVIAFIQRSDSKLSILFCSIKKEKQYPFKYRYILGELA